MSSYPIYEILFFLALFFAPEETREFEIMGENESLIHFHLTENGWMDSRENRTWRGEGNTIYFGDESHDVSRYVEGIVGHSWKEESILHLGKADVIKTKDAIVYYPNGIDSPKDKYTITYN